MTRWLTGDEVAAAADRLVPASVARSDSMACYLTPATLVEVCTALRDDKDMDLKHLTNLCGVDYWERFEVVYHVQSFDKNQIATLKVEVLGREGLAVPSVVPVWYGAWMQECEAYDLLGIRFEGHPNLHRLLLWDGYPGYPLRKDFLAIPGSQQTGLGDHPGSTPHEPPPVKVVE